MLSETGYQFLFGEELNAFALGEAVHFSDDVIPYSFFAPTFVLNRLVKDMQIMVCITSHYRIVKK